MNKSGQARELRHQVEPSLIVQIRKANPCATLREIGKQGGISRQRVQKILDREGLPTASVRVYKYPCPQCGKRLTKQPKRGMCRACYTKEMVFADLPCTECGAITRKRISNIIGNCRHGGHGHVFCNRHCFGRWRGKSFGFGVHPENQRRGLLTHAARRRKVAEAELCPPYAKEPRA